MSWTSGVRARLRQFIRRAAAEERTDEEIRFHIEMETEQKLREGMNPEEARRRARIAFGAVEAHRADLRDGRRLVVLEDLAQDVRYAARSLRRDALWTTLALLIVGSGIGASVTVFSLVHALLLRPLPFHEPERLVWIANGASERLPSLEEDLSARTVQVAQLQKLRTESRALADVAGFSPFYKAGDHHLVGAGEPERLTGVPVTENFFPVLGVEPQFGRAFTSEESTWGGPKAVLLSHQFWSRRFASDAEVVGRALLIDDRPVTVVGVLPASFDFGHVFAPGRRIDFFSTFPLSPETNRQGNTLALVGRLRPGVPLEAAAAELTTFVVPPRHDAGLNAFTPRVRTLREHVSGAFRPALLVLAGAVGLVMLIVCANLSNLLLTRMASREKEIAVRAALGAGRGRLVRQLLTESLLLSCGGAVLGLLLAMGSTRLLTDANALSLPLLDRVQVDWTAFGFAAVIAILTGMAVGLTPALRVAAPVVDGALKDASRGSSAGRRQGRIQGALVVSEVALACMLLVGAGLLTRSFLSVLDVDLGFQPEGAVAVRIDPSSAFPTQALRTAYYDEAMRRARAAPGIQAAGLTDALPLGWTRQWGVTAPGRSHAPEARPQAFIRIVSEQYLRAMGIPVRAGRDFTTADDASSRPVVIVNETLAQTLWPGEDPLGRVLSAGTDAAGRMQEREVVGIVAGTRHQTLEKESDSEVYIPLRQTGDYSAVHMVVRGPLASAGLVSAVRAALRPMDARLPMTEVRIIQNLVDRSVSPRRLVVLLLVGFAGFALVLASLGIYGVISYGVTQRTREFGIRLALGASAGALQRGILLQTVHLAAAGTALGLLGAYAFARMIQSQLFGISSSDPMAFGAAIAMLSAVAVIAGYLPARRASHLDPVDALRAE